MSEVYLGNNASIVTDAPALDGYTKVIINIDDETSIEVGNDEGLVMELDCPWGTQAMAENILASLSGYSYQPYQADGSILNPASELGDAVTAHGVYGAVYKRDTYFDSLHTADIEAPFDEEMDHEYEYEPQQERKVRRQFENVQSQLSVQAGEIAARVTRTGGESSSFGWSLTEDGFILSSGSKTVFECNSDGIIVSGEIRATSGFIGSNENYGFKITGNSIANGMTSLTDSEHDGVFISTSGISLGRNGAFRVDSSGNLYAATGTFEGSVNAGSIRYDSEGGRYGMFNGAGLSGGSVSTGKIADYAITKKKLASALGVDIDTSVAFIKGCTNGTSSLSLNGCAANTVAATSSFYFKGSQVYKESGTGYLKC